MATKNAKTYCSAINTHVFCEFSLFWATSHLFQEESQVIRDESTHHDTVHVSSLEQQICESANYTLIVRRNWSPRPSATRSYLGLIECRYSVLSSITSIVVGLLCSEFYIVAYFLIFWKPYISLSIPTIKY